MNTPLCFASVRRDRQQGMVLVTALIFLVVLTLLTMSSMGGAILEERMAGSLRDWNVAFQAAESGLRDAQREILSGLRISGATGFAQDCSNTSADYKGLCLVQEDGSPIWVDLETNAAATGWVTGDDDITTVKYGTYTAVPPLAGVGKQPRYVVEVMEVKDGPLNQPKGYVVATKKVYRVTGVGFGARSGSRVMLQATYRSN